MQTKILIADQYPIISVGISRIISEIDSNAKFLPLAKNGEELLDSLKLFYPDILILELDLPNTYGIQIIKDIKERFRNTKVIIFSHQPDEIYALSTIKAGVSAYIPKNVDAKTIQLAYSRVARGGIYLSESLTKQLNDRNFKNTHYNAFKKLSSREVEVLNLLSTGKRNKEIATSLAINEKTVSTYKTRLLKKLKANTVAELITQSRILQIC